MGDLDVPLPEHVCGRTCVSLYLSRCVWGDLGVPLPEPVCVRGLGCPFT